MKKIKVAIVDDEPIARDILESFLERMGGLEIVGRCSNALEAFSLVSSHEVDLLLLDINMPGLTGMDFLRSLKQPPLVVFTTAYTDYAVDSYELNAVDYLVKPIAYARFEKAIQKVMNLIQKTEPDTPTVNAEETDSNLFVRSGGKWVKLDITQIWLVEGLKDYLKVWVGENRLVIHQTMKNFEEQVRMYPSMMRVHKSYIVNLNHVDEVDSTQLKIKDQIIPIGNTYKDEVLKRFRGR